MTRRAGEQPIAHRPRARCSSPPSPPRASAAQHDDGAAPFTARGLAVPTPAPQRPLDHVHDAPGTVLLIEDNEDNQVVCAAILRHVGHSVQIASDGERGVALALANPPDVILMDVAMPRIDGWEATARLKADPRTCAVPIIAFTAHVLERDRAEARRVGCDDFLAKPVDMRELVATVARWIASGRGRAHGTGDAGGAAPVRARQGMRSDAASTSSGEPGGEGG